MYIGDSLTFRRKISLASAELKCKPSKPEGEKDVATQIKLFLNKFTDYILSRVC
jgi:hypothetical protein